MDPTMAEATPTVAQQDTTEPEAPSLAPPSSTSLLSDVPTTDPADPADAEPKQVANTETANVPAETAAGPQSPDLADQHHQGNTSTTALANPPGWDAAKEETMSGIIASGNTPAQTPATDAIHAKPGGRGGKRTSLGDVNSTPQGTEAAQTTTASSGRGRGRGGGRPRGRGRGGGRGGKRKREDGSDGESSDSEVATPVVTMTKSGRNVQKPTSFAPPPPSPTTTTKRKRTYRRNPESAVCKMCLRGTSPASNMIVFCDGCNTPYHRYCHQPPINQAVIDEVDKEWYCKPCENERIVPVPEADVASFVSAPLAPSEQRQKYFASLPPGMLVTLLTKATTLKPDLPLFGPDFEARASTSSAAGAPTQAIPSNGYPPQAQISRAAQPAAPAHLPRQYPPSMASQSMQSYTEDPRYPVPDEHPAHYVRPGQGLMQSLPPEQNDMHYLVDDDRYQVFSHYHIDPQQQNANAGMEFAGGQSMGQGTGMGMGMGMSMGMGQARPGA